MTDVVMPQMGESIVEGTLTKWLKKPGDRVERDEPLFEISTDKVDTEIPSPAAGTLAEILVEEGKTVGINTVVARIDEGGGGGAQPAAAKPAEAAEAEPRPPGCRNPAARRPAPPARRRRPAPAPRARARSAAEAAEPAGPLSPLVRKMARENNLDLSQVKGTGAGGRITKQDVEALPGARRRRAGCPRQLPRAAPPPAAAPRRRSTPPPATAAAAPLPRGAGQDAHRAA